jgi:hypothetical protein
MKFELAPSAGAESNTHWCDLLYVREASADVRRAQIDPRDEASTTLVGITYNWWRRQACLPFGPNQSKTLLASFALDLAAMDGSLARDAAQAVRVALVHASRLIILKSAAENPSARQVTN